MAGTIVVDRIESDASYASTINVAGQITFSNTVNFGAFAGTAPVAGFYLPTTNNLAFTTASTERMRIDSSGNVGIGTASPGAKFSLTSTGSTTADGVRLTFGSEARAHNIYSALPTGRDLTIAPYRALTINTGSGTAEGVLALNAYEYTTFGTGSSYTERMRIDSSGNLLVNTTTASSKFCVNAEMSLLTDGNNRGIIGWDNTNKLISFGTINASTTYFNAMSLRDGNLLVGRTSQSGVEKLGVVGNAGGSIIMSLQRPTESVSFIGCDNAQSFRVYDSGSVQRFGVTVAGSCQNTTGSYGTLSDEKLKENIVDATPKLDALMQVKVRNYGLKAEPNSKFIGFIAQELRETFPSMVEENPDEDENGKKTGEVTLAVKTTVFIPMLVKAIQELKAINDTQAETINALTARIVALESK